MEITRRGSLALAGVLAAGAFGVPLPALGRDSLQDLLVETLRQAPQRADWLLLDVPAEADNAAAVPVTVSVEPPEETGLTCDELLVVAEGNPRPAACRFVFASALAVPTVTTRIRLAESQYIAALARMSDGSLIMARTPVEIVQGGCG